MSDDPRDFLRRSPSSATGLSLVAGEPLRDPADLPDYRVEVHVLVDDDVADCSVAGLAYQPVNTVAWTWEPGRRLGNRCVVVARLDEPRPPGDSLAECVPLVQHARTSWEHGDFSASMGEIYAERDREAAADREATAPLRAVLAAEGLRVAQHAARWVVIDGGVIVELRSDGRYRVGCSVDYHARVGDEDLRARLSALALARDWTLDPAEPYELADQVADGPEAAVALAQGARSLVAEFPGVVADFWHERFVDGFRLTRRLREFLVAGAEGGVHVTYERRNLRARAGGVLLKASDVSRLVSARWLAADRPTGIRSLTVTEAGLAAARAA